MFFLIAVQNYGIRVSCVIHNKPQKESPDIRPGLIPSLQQKTEDQHP
jgi:hypothetical protein